MEPIRTMEPVRRRMYDPLNWYWLAEDGRLYSSKTESLVSEDNAVYAAWLIQNHFPTPWPKDQDGRQTVEALNEVLAHFGKTVKC